MCLQGQLLPEYKKRIDIESVCRGFLDVAKLAIKPLCESIYNGRLGTSADGDPYEHVRMSTPMPLMHACMGMPLRS